jgi:hypothetical protein
MDYFKQYKNNFKFNKDKNYKENFKLLKQLKKWNSTKASQEWQSLNDCFIQTELQELEDYSEPEFFDYFSRQFSFNPCEDDTTEEKFNNLAEYMKWDEEAQDDVEEYLCYECEATDNYYDHYYHIEDEHFSAFDDMEDFKEYCSLVFDFEYEGSERKYFMNLLDHIGLSNGRDEKAIALLAQEYFLLEQSFHNRCLEKEDIFNYFSSVFGYRFSTQDYLKKFNNIIKFLDLDEDDDEEHKIIVSLRRFYFYSRLQHYKNNRTQNSFFKYFDKHFDFELKGNNKKKSFQHLISFLGLSADNERDNKVISDLRNHFYEEINESVERTFKDDRIESLQSIIRNYGLCSNSEMPQTITQCKELIENELFANIFDFVDGNYKRFKSESALARYSKMEEKIYPLNRAKDTYAYKVLLRTFFY